MLYWVWRLKAGTLDVRCYVTFDEKLAKAEKAASAAWKRYEDASHAASVIGSQASISRARKGYLLAERLGQQAATLRTQARAWEAEDRLRAHQRSLEDDFWA